MEKHSQYFEGILQLRNTDKDVLDFVLNLVEKRDGVSVSKIEKVANGLDLYFTSQKFLQQVGKKLKGNFNGELKTSVKLFTRNRITGKEVYRVNVLFRQHNIKKGDIIPYKGEEVQIIGVGKKILAKNTKTGKKLTLNFKDL